jgi:ribosome biogenesis GTPase / thiamine phosphate phosphatase
VLVANVEQVIVVAAAAQPEPRLRLLDRLLVLAEANELPASSSSTRSISPKANDLRARFAAYSAADYTLVLTSAVTGRRRRRAGRRGCAAAKAC